MKSWIRQGLGHYDGQLVNSLYYLPEVDSTNTVAAQLARCGVGEGCLVAAPCQKKGRGRMQRSFVSPRGGIYISLILRPQVEASLHRLLSLLAPCAVLDALAETGLSGKIKWPNDVLVGGKKIAGILLQAGPSWVVLGIGINGNFARESLPKSLTGTATTISSELGRPAELGRVLAALLSGLERRYHLLTTGKTEDILKEWRACSATLGKQVVVTTARGKIRGLAVDVNERGALIITNEEDGEIDVEAGDVMLREDRRMTDERQHN